MSSSNDQLETIMEESKDYISLSSTQGKRSFSDVNFQSFNTSRSFTDQSTFHDKGIHDANFQSFQTITGSSINDLDKLNISQLSSIQSSL